MTPSFYPGDDATPTPADVEVMTDVLEGRHGALAADVADFLSTFHGQRGDAGRSWAWAGVVERVRRRELARLSRD
jgi:hypothetical protein